MGNESLFCLRGATVVEREFCFITGIIDMLLYKRLFNNDLKSHLFIFSNLIDDFCIVYIYFAMSYINILTV